MSKLTCKSVAVLLASLLAVGFLAGCSQEANNAKGQDPILNKKDARDASIAAKQNDMANPDK